MTRDPLLCCSQGNRSASLQSCSHAGGWRGDQGKLELVLTDHNWVEDNPLVLISNTGKFNKLLIDFKELQGLVFYRNKHISDSLEFFRFFS